MKFQLEGYQEMTHLRINKIKEWCCTFTAYETNSTHFLRDIGISEIQTTKGFN